MEVVSKQEFAALVGVSPPCVSQWISRKKISGAALVGRGYKARIRADVARDQLKRTLDISQHLGANGKAKLGAQKPAASVREAPCATVAALNLGKPASAAPDEAETVEDRIKQARLAQLSLSNAKASEEAAARAGRYAKTADVQQQMGRIAARLMTVFEASLNEFANAVIAAPPVTPRDALRTLRATWREIRVRQAKAAGTEAGALPPLVDDEGEPDASAC